MTLCLCSYAIRRLADSEHRAVPCAPSGHVVCCRGSANCKPAWHTDYKSMFRISSLVHVYYYFSSSVSLFQILDSLWELA